jgi:hypothetical protein
MASRAASSQIRATEWVASAVGTQAAGLAVEGAGVTAGLAVGATLATGLGTGAADGDAANPDDVERVTASRAPTAPSVASRRGRTECAE